MGLKNMPTDMEKERTLVTCHVEPVLLKRSHRGLTLQLIALATLAWPLPASSTSRALTNAPKLAVQLVSDDTGYCASLKSGGVVCWGDNAYGALGSGSTAIDSSVPVVVEGLAGAVSVVSDGDGYCALLQSGSAACWGDNADGVLGNGSKAGYSDVPVTVRGLSGAASLVSDRGLPGFESYCALLKTGGAKCWGANIYGALGANTDVPSSGVPLAVHGLTAAVSLTGEGEGLSYCAVLRNTGAECWGDNEAGLLGDGIGSVLGSGPQPYSDIPVKVKGLSGVLSISTSLNSYCALLGTGRVECWGGNAGGALGDGSSYRLYSASPSKVVGLSGAAQLLGGGENSYCAVLRTGRVECWGGNGGALGDGDDAPDVAVGVRGLSSAVGMASDAEAPGYCAVLRDGSANCWGSNGLGGGYGYGVLGDGSNVKESNVPQRVKDLAGVLSLVSDDLGYCALLKEGGAECWGDNVLLASDTSADGQLGDGGAELRSNVPVRVVGLGP
jgi:alpha-tubulin suppressor-like RCC1 family protein